MAKADALADVVRTLRIPAAALRAYGDREWGWLATIADVKPAIIGNSGTCARAGRHCLPAT